MALRTIGAFGCLLSLVSAGAVAAAPNEIRLKPETPWVVERTADRCQMARKFSYGGKPALLSMRTYAPGYNFEITTAGEPVRFLQGAKAATIAYGAQEPRAITATLRGKNRDYGPALIFSQTITGLEVRTGPTPASTLSDPAFEAQADRVTIVSSSRRVVFETGAMVKAFQALHACTDTLIRSWGLDPKVQHDLSRMARPVDLEWARQVQMAYPIALAVKGRHARAHLRLLITPEGVPATCSASQAFANTDFKVNACDISMKGARFDPALDKAGHPVASYFTTTIIYYR